MRGCEEDRSSRQICNVTLWRIILADSHLGSDSFDSIFWFHLFNVQRSKIYFLRIEGNKRRHLLRMIVERKISERIQRPISVHHLAHYGGQSIDHGLRLILEQLISQFRILYIDNQLCKHCSLLID